jgi:hypothetical protein
MRFSQGGKFEHGFLSGFVSSIGGAKFANGTVTGAYVIRVVDLKPYWKVIK